MVKSDQVKSGWYTSKTPRQIRLTMRMMVKFLKMVYTGMLKYCYSHFGLAKERRDNSVY